MSARWPWPCLHCEDPGHLHVPQGDEFKCLFSSTVYVPMSAAQMLRHGYENKHNLTLRGDLWRERYNDRRKAAKTELRERDMHRAIHEEYDESRSLPARALLALRKTRRIK